jgi:hypothetical protein
MILIIVFKHHAVTDVFHVIKIIIALRVVKDIFNIMLEMKSHA